MLIRNFGAIENIPTNIWDEADGGRWREPENIIDLTNDDDDDIIDLTKDDEIDLIQDDDTIIAEGEETGTVAAGWDMDFSEGDSAQANSNGIACFSPCYCPTSPVGSDTSSYVPTSPVIYFPTWSW